MRDTRGFTREQIERHEKNIKDLKESRSLGNPKEFYWGSKRNNELIEHRFDMNILDKAESETGLGFEGLFRMKDFDMKHKWELKQVFTDLKSRVNLILELIDERGVPKNWSMRRKMALSILISGLVIDVPSWRDLDERSEEFKRCWESYREEKFEE
tara:strand:+ start:1557 stop:2024 length:468 start_codon:yes stop_codon:yes gene_type:complete